MPTKTNPAPTAVLFPGTADTRAPSAVPHTPGLDCYSLNADIEHCAVCGAFIPDNDLDVEEDFARANEEPDYEAMAQAREEAREAAYLDRMDRRY